jgi:hypothetical protein
MIILVLAECEDVPIVYFILPTLRDSDLLQKLALARIYYIAVMNNYKAPIRRLH